MKTESFPIMSLLMIVLLVIINMILMVPITEKVTQLTISSMPIASEQAAMVLSMTHKMRYIQIFGAAFSSVITLLVYALLLFIFVRISKNRIDFSKIFQLITCCYIVVVIGSLVNTALLHMRGIDEIKNMYDITVTGVNVLTSIEQVGVASYVFLSYINPFQLWFVALLSIGLVVVADMKAAKAIVISVLFWLVTVLFPVLTVYFSQAVLAKAGM